MTEAIEKVDVVPAEVQKEAADKVKQFFVEHALEAAQTIARIMKQPQRNAQSQLAAAQSVIDRTLGTVTTKENQTNIQVIVSEKAVEAWARRGLRIPDDAILTEAGELKE